MIIVACDYYGIDPDIPLAIARLETGHFTSAPFLEGNNVGGMSRNEIPITYRSVEDSVDEFVRNLSENYFGKGYTTVEAISKKYCPAKADEWAELVRELM